MLKRFASLLVGSSLLLSGAVSADTIHLTDGSTIDDVEVDEETLTSVTYKETKRLESIPSDRVLKIDYTKLPSELDQVATALYDGDFELASKDLFSYVKGLLAGEKERRKWAPPYAVHQLIEVYKTLDDAEGVIEAADVMLKHYPTSRYVSDAYLAKARALYERQMLDQANETLTDFK